MTREMLGDLLVDVPRYRRARRRRRLACRDDQRRRSFAFWTSAVALVVVLVGFGALNFDRPPPPVTPADQTVGVSGYPGVVPRPGVSTDVAAAPGPMAGVIEGEGIAEWSLVDAAGRSWQVPDVNELDSFPLALSDDGRWLGRLGADHGPGPTEGFYVITDLVTGATHEFPQVGDSRTLGLGGRGQPVLLGVTPGSGVLVARQPLALPPGGTGDGRGRSSLLLSVDGEVRVLGLEGWPAGWLGRRSAGPAPAGGELVTVDLAGSSPACSSKVPRRPRPSTSGRGDSRRSGPASPWSPGQVGAASWRRTTRRPDSWWTPAPRTTGGPTPASSCGRAIVSWPGPTTTGSSTRGAGSRSSGSPGDWPPTTCGQFATDALAGPAQPGPGLTEWRYWSWLWWDGSRSWSGWRSRSWSWPWRCTPSAGVWADPPRLLGISESPAQLAVGFDLDMTLIDTVPGFARVLEVLGAELGVEFPVARADLQAGPAPGDDARALPRREAIGTRATGPGALPGPRRSRRCPSCPARTSAGRRAVARRAHRRRDGQLPPPTPGFPHHLGLDIDVLEGWVWGVGKAEVLRRGGRERLRRRPRARRQGTLPRGS